MRSEYRWVKERLHAWAQWRRKDITVLGYPSITAEAKLRESPGSSTKPGKGPEYWPPTDEVKETNEIIGQMESTEQIALWCRYVQDIRPDRGAIVCGVGSTNEYWNLVERSERAFGKAVRESS